MSISARQRLLAYRDKLRNSPPLKRVVVRRNRDAHSGELMLVLTVF
ncbi:hypothetical protein [Stagnimonas aquatica]|nr:hypothetical protein [Stagnimonas aquatica]